MIRIPPETTHIVADGGYLMFYWVTPKGIQIYTSDNTWEPSAYSTLSQMHEEYWNIHKIVPSEE